MGSIPLFCLFPIQYTMRRITGKPWRRCDMMLREETSCSPAEGKGAAGNMTFMHGESKPVGARRAQASADRVERHVNSIAKPAREKQ